jgi:hypothetical protein
VEGSGGSRRRQHAGSAIAPGEVEHLLEQLYLAGGAPRQRKKAQEVAGLLALLAEVVPQPVPRGKPRLLVDAAAGNGYVGLCAAALLGWRRVIAVEQQAALAGRVRKAAAGLCQDIGLDLVVRAERVGATALPMRPDAVVALHACGPATDAVLAAAIAAEARWILCAPCCYGAAVEGWTAAQATADRLGLGRAAHVRGRFAAALIDDARLARLAAAGYESQLVPFAAPTVTPHHLVLRARRGGRA